MLRIVFDLETNGFLENVTTIHCITTEDLDTGDVGAYHDIPSFSPCTGSIADGIAYLMTADELIGHNIQKYDLPVLRKLRPEFHSTARVRDTMITARLIWPDIKSNDLGRVKRGKFPSYLVGKHSLEAWGHRLDEHKGAYTGGWEAFSQEMLTYGLQDIAVTSKLHRTIMKKDYSEQAIQLEHDVQEIITLQEIAGFRFNVAKAATLYGKLVQRHNELAELLRVAFDPWYVAKEVFTPKRDDNAKGYVKGAPFTKIALTLFNPASRDHIANRMMKLYGWKPTVFTNGGKPQVDEKSLAPLKFPASKWLLEYLLIDKRIGQVSEGKEAWLKKEKNGRIHGVVMTMGTVTGRMSHQWPNIAQVPKVGSPYGAECRELFEAGPGNDLVGADASGLELRCLAHFLAKWDEGAYANAVTQGKEEDQTDVHSLTALALGLDPKASYTFGGKVGSGRNFAKTFIYAFLYGAGDGKLGSIVGQGAGRGRVLKKDFITKVPGMKALKDKVTASSKRGFLIGLDGRQLIVRSDHAALNVLLQSAGALVMKQALVFLYADLTASGYIHGRDYSFVANIHDEFQIEARKDIAHDIGQRAVSSIRRSGEHFAFRCPLDGATKVGSNWAETH